MVSWWVEQWQTSSGLQEGRLEGNSSSPSYGSVRDQGMPRTPVDSRPRTWRFFLWSRHRVQHWRHCWGATCHSWLQPRLSLKSSWDTVLMEAACCNSSLCVPVTMWKTQMESLAPSLSLAQTQLLRALGSTGAEQERGEWLPPMSGHLCMGQLNKYKTRFLPDFFINCLTDKNMVLSISIKIS